MSSSILVILQTPVKLPSGVVTKTLLPKPKEMLPPPGQKSMTVTEMIVISESETSSPADSDSESFIIVEEEPTRRRGSN